VKCGPIFFEFSTDRSEIIGVQTYRQETGAAYVAAAGYDLIDDTVAVIV
jgi:hypothetical protein